MSESPGALGLSESLRIVRGSRPDAWDAQVPSDAGFRYVAAAGAVPLVVEPVAPAVAVRHALTRIADSDGVLKAWVHVDVEGVTRRAGEAEARLAQGAPRRLLEGIAIGVKDVIDVAGMPCRAGFAPFADRVPAQDAPVVARLVHHGAMVVGKTATTQFAFSDPAPTVNPVDASRTPGGSSSGSAVAVAAGHVPVALGTQTSGSTIRPASYNGVIGFKPSRGLVSRGGVFPVSPSLDEVGFFARGVGECDLAARAIGLPLREETSTSPLRIGVVEDAFELAADEVSQRVSDVADLLARADAQLLPVRLGLLSEIAAAHQIVMTAEIGAQHAGLYSQHAEHYASRIGQVVREGLDLLSRDYLHALQLQRVLIAVTTAIFRDVDLWILPSVADVAPGRQTTGDRSLQIPASLLGLPAISVPAGFSAAGLPIGVQLVGPAGEDGRVLRMAAVLTAATVRSGLVSP
jgi:aspartyl-tRNA(Asn)/glutamyl-tRNA(Gln) amidotransferase subunit A